MRVAADASVDARTVARSLRGGVTRQSKVVRAAIVAALRKHGFKAEALELEREGNNHADRK